MARLTLFILLKSANIMSTCFSGSDWPALVSWSLSSFSASDLSTPMFKRKTNSSPRTLSMRPSAKKILQKILISNKKRSST